VYPRRPFAPFAGPRLRPGALIAERELWPADDFPARPLLFEYAGIAETGRGHRRSTQLYILWRYERESSTWRELARATATGLEWVEVLRTAALHDLRSEPEDLARAAAAASSRVLAAVEAEMALLDRTPAQIFLGFLWDSFQARLVREEDFGIENGIESTDSLLYLESRRV
jgi:hypothetical protein